MIRITRSGKGAFVYGPVALFGNSVPKYMKVVGVWPNMTFLFLDVRDQVSNKLTLRKGGKVFQVSLPSVTLGLPIDLSPADDDSVWSRVGPREFALRLAHDEEPPPEEAEQHGTEETREGIETRATEILLEFAAHCERYHELFDDSLPDVLGVALHYEDDEEQEEFEPEDEDDNNPPSLASAPVALLAYEPVPAVLEMQTHNPVPVAAEATGLRLTLLSSTALASSCRTPENKPETKWMPPEPSQFPTVSSLEITIEVKAAKTLHNPRVSRRPRIPRSRHARFQPRLPKRRLIS